MPLLGRLIVFFPSSIIFAGVTHVNNSRTHIEKKIIAYLIEVSSTSDVNTGVGTRQNLCYRLCVLAVHWFQNVFTTNLKQSGSDTLLVHKAQLSVFKNPAPAQWGLVNIKNQPIKTTSFVLLFCHWLELSYWLIARRWFLKPRDGLCVLAVYFSHVFVQRTIC